MQKFLEILKQVSLFAGISENDLIPMMKCLGASVRRYEKGSFVINAGDPMNSIGILVGGIAEVIKEDAFGRKTIVTNLKIADMFGEAMVCAGSPASTVSVYVTENANVLWLDYDKIVKTCSNACEFHHRLVLNMLKILAQKNILLMRKLDYTTQKGMREKLSAFLLDMCGGKSEFEIPFNREQLADFLSVDRSALSRELGRMRDEGLITFQKNRFKLHKEF